MAGRASSAPSPAASSRACSRSGPWATRGARATRTCLAIPIATAIGRVGCYLSELPLGTPTDLPWGVSVDPAAAAAFPRCPGCDVAMHPSMLYEVAFNLAVIPLIIWLRPRVPIQGDLLKGYLLVAFVFRFGVELVRGNEVQAAGLTGPQLVLIPLVALLVVHFVRRVRSGVYRVPAAPAAISRSWSGEGGTA